MRRRLLFWELSGFLFTSAAGCLLHFVYEWSGRSVIASVFSSVNESTWEHMKLLFFPLLLFSVIQFCFVGKYYPNFFAARAVSTLAGLSLIPLLFYTYSGILGYNVNWVNISIFILAVLSAFILDASLLRKNKFPALWQQVLGMLVLWVLAFCFVWYTFHPPALGLWQDPVAAQFDGI